MPKETVEVTAEAIESSSELPSSEQSNNDDAADVAVKYARANSKKYVSFDHFWSQEEDDRCRAGLGFRAEKYKSNG